MSSFLTIAYHSLKLLAQIMQIGGDLLALGSFGLLVVALVATELGRNIICGVCFGIFDLTKRMALVVSKFPWYAVCVAICHAIACCLFLILTPQASRQIWTPQPPEPLPMAANDDGNSPPASPTARALEPRMMARCSGVTRDPGPDGDYRCHRIANIDPHDITTYYCNQHMKQKVARRYYS